MTRKNPRRTRVIDWLVCGAVGIVALMFLAAGVFGNLHGTTPEDELITVTGVANNAGVSTVTGRYGATTDFLWFAVDGYRVSYASDQDGYDRVLDAIRAGREITIGVSTKRETLFPRKDWVPLHTLSVEADPILTYETTVTKGYRGSNAVFMVGGVLLAISLWSLYRCHMNRNIPNT